MEYENRLKKLKKIVGVQPICKFPEEQSSLCYIPPLTITFHTLIHTTGMSFFPILDYDSMPDNNTELCRVC